MKILTDVISAIILIGFIFIGLELVAVGVMDFGDRPWIRTLVILPGMIFLFVAFRGLTIGMKKL